MVHRSEMKQEGSEMATCFECLERRIHSDFSTDVFFRYGVSDSALPFGSTAVVQVNLGKGAEQSAGDDVPTQFVLVRLRKQEACFGDANIGSDSSKNVMGDNVRGEGVNALSENTQCLIEAKNGVPQDLPPSTSTENDAQSSYNVLSKCMSTMGPNSSIMKVIAALALTTYAGTGCYSAVEDLACKFLTGSVEDLVMSSLNLLVEGNTPGQYGDAFLNLIGVPTFDGNVGPTCVRHPNIVPILGMLITPGYVNLLQPKAPYSLENILHYSPKSLKSDWHIRFLVYQILSALTRFHGFGVAHGGICPSNILLTDSCWPWLSVSDKHFLQSDLRVNVPSVSSRVCCSVENCSSHGLYANLKLSSSIDWHSNFKQWWTGELSNYEYLLFLNRLAGRRWGDHTFHTVMPWVIDFSIKPDESSDTGWRDLQKSKWRLAKGDEQLDFTYLTSEIPHHVSDECLSELAVCSYKARRLPLSILRSAVRSVYEPNEYPSNMQRLYQWTPDECIPEFYSDPRIFLSLHSGMSNLAVPSWAASPEDFISLHRAALESDRVSLQIHHWIDITFGYKLSGDAAILAKNVMLPPSDPTMPKSTGRRQLFTKPHPIRRGCRKSSCHYVDDRVQGIEIMKDPNVISDVPNSLPQSCLLSETGHLHELEEASSFCEHARHLSPMYSENENHVGDPSSQKVQANEQFEMSKTSDSSSVISSDIHLASLLEHFEGDDSGVFQELLLWRKRSSMSGNFSKDVAGDIFSFGCILSELYLKRPLFDRVSLAAYVECSDMPGLMHALPPQVQLLVEACTQKDWRRRPSAKCLLESQFFPPTVKSAYLFLSPLSLLSKTGLRLKFAARLASEGALKLMGPFAAEMCAPYCLPLITTPLPDVESESAFCLLKEFLKCLKCHAIKALILPIIRKILQGTDYSHLKVSLLQDSFVREVWKRLGKQIYLEKMHPLVISNLCNSPNKISAAAASVLLIGSSEELGVPVVVHQTILPLLQCFGKGLCADGLDALVRIGGLLGENFIIKQLLPLLRNIVLSSIDVSYMNKSEPLLSWNALALVHSFTALNGLTSLLPREVVLKELVLDQICLPVKVLMQAHLDLPVIQVAAMFLIAVCQQIGLEFTALHVLPQLKELFDELAYSHEVAGGNGFSRKDLKVSGSKLDGGSTFESRMDLVLLLYPSFASIVGIEKLRQCCATWFLLEQFLQRYHNWKWEYVGLSGSIENSIAQRPMPGKTALSEYDTSKLLLNGVGWSIPQSQGFRSGRQRVTDTKDTNLYVPRHEPYFWFPSAAASWDGPEFLGRVGSLKDELPWKIKASILYSARAHPGALRSLAVCHDECVIFTGGVGPGFKGNVEKWELPRINCLSGYYGHDEVVNDICILSVSGRIASCDGTIHVWNHQSGKTIATYAETSTNFSHHASSLTIASKMNTDQTNMLTPNALSGGILSGAFSGNLYTCMHFLESDDKLVAGIGNGSVRFIDVAQDRKLHLWKSDTVESSFSFLVSAICSCGSEKFKGERDLSSPSWIAAGLSSGFCRLLDARSGNVISHWRAHDGYITKLAAPEDHLLVSSSLDRTLRVWDLRRNLPSPMHVFRGHSDVISSFAIWGQDVISVSRNKIGLSSLAKSPDEGGQQQLLPQKLYLADRGTRNLSIISTISILPFSRLFLVGTEDGYLKICC